MPLSTALLDKCLAKTFYLNGQKAPGRNVEEHCRIAGAVANELLKRLLAFWPAGQSLFPENCDLAPLIHDVGKVLPAFQARIYNNIKAVLNELKGYDIIHYNGHASVSAAAVKHAKGSARLANCVGKHHGSNVMENRADCDIYGGPDWEELRQALIQRLCAGRSFPKIENGDIEELIGGLTIVADWISSGGIFENPDQPWEPLIPAALDQACYRWPEIRRDLTFESIFGFKPNHIQIALSEMVDGPGVYVLEAPMGCGKTEAALYAAYRLLAKGSASGIYFGLPTQLTSNRMHERVETFLARILLDTDQKTGVVLAHGNAWLKRYLDQRMGCENAPGKSWFENGRKAVLAPFGVGTMDQALLSALRVAWANLRVMGLAGKVVIMDEVHSYDAYTGYLLERLAKRLASLGSAVIILSATLTKHRRESLLAAGPASDGNMDMPALDYPLISAASNLSGRSVRMPQFSASAETRIISKEDDKLALEEMLNRAYDGQQCVWIENTVDKAQEIFKLLAARSSGGDVQLGLIHSRFIACDRGTNEAWWTGILGKSASPKERYKCGRILVGTQVLEQSLDIDADFLVTRFAPTDLLLQRIGRLWRHPRHDRPDTAQREAWLLAPPLDKAHADPRGAFKHSLTSWVYPPYILGRSLEIWAPLNKVSIPGQIRQLLEDTHTRRDKEPTAAMENARKELEKDVTCRINRARNVSSTYGGFMEDKEARTRLSDIETVDMLLLSDLNLDTGDCRLLNGKTINLADAHTDKRAKAADLYSSLLKIPVSRAPDKSLGKSHALLGPYIYGAATHQWEGKPIEPSLRVLLIGADGNARDIYARPVPGISYNSRLGYMNIKN